MIPSPVPAKVDAAAPPAVDTASVATLDYSTPRVFFSGVYHFRSRDAAFVAVISAGMSVGFGLAAVWGVGLVGPLLFGAVSIASLAYAAHCANGFIHARMDRVRITSDGIEKGGRLWSWQRVSSLSASGRVGSVTLECFIGRGLVKRCRRLPVSPSPSSHDYIKLSRELTAYLRMNHPHVEVDPEPRRGTGE